MRHHDSGIIFSSKFSQYENGYGIDLQESCLISLTPLMMSEKLHLK